MKTCLRPHLMLSLLLLTCCTRLCSAYVIEVGLRSPGVNRSSDSAKPACLEVRPSKIPNAGKGLFATCEMKAGTSIGEYLGSVSEVPPEDTDYVWCAPICQDTNFNVHMDNEKEMKECAPVSWRYTDAKDVLTSLLRFANSVRSQALRGSLNVEARFQGGHVFYDLSRDVQPGDELLIDYGQGYWKSRGNEYPNLIAIVLGITGGATFALSVVTAVLMVL
eukprot:gnl/MRDRNA2_/MRDRNA2_27369_c0_seq1.p1 gnl/MRDRNA2_/MRDRNA2_27369_c0~~gnl/MRDRNA2_/MRDRNA2_27369_c0_seq1.p1  ORF type:complete len:220 (+),score=17.52 gnl/MRDRNA2_/MRDRNA2_27369_c0_seq1:58-717(+)